MFRESNIFIQQSLEDLIPEVIYLYFFDNLSLTQIELKLINTTQFHGWISKVFLNYYGIDTSGYNKGLYQGRNISEVVDELSRSSMINHVKVAKILRKKYLI